MKWRWRKAINVAVVLVLVAVGALLFSQPVYAAAPTVQSVTGQTADAVDQVIVSSVPGGTRQLYIAVVHLYTSGGTPGTSEVSSMSGGSLTWALITGTVGCAGRISQPRTEMWWAFGSPSSFDLTVDLAHTTLVAGAHVAVVRISGAPNQMPINGEYANINGDQGACSSGTDNTAPTIGATVSNVNSLILNSCLPRNQADGVTTPDADYTQQYEVINIDGGNSSTIWLGTRANPSVGTETITHTLGSAKPWIMAVIEIKSVWDSYSNSGHSTSCDVFDDYDTESTIYMNGGGYTPSTNYRVVFWDQVDSSWINRQTQDLTSGVTGNLSALHTLAPGTDTAGDWHCTVYDSTSYSPASYNVTDNHIVTDDVSYAGDIAFTVAAGSIPEFPTLFAAAGVAGLCFGIYYWMRKKAKFKMQSAK